MSDYTIKLTYNPKPIPDRKLDWDCWIDGEEEDGLIHGATPWEALRDLADRLEDDAEIQARAEEPKCPACNIAPCLCDYKRSYHGIRTEIEADLGLGRSAMRLPMPHYSIIDALNILSCESLLEHQP